MINENLVAKNEYFESFHLHFSIKKKTQKFGENEQARKYTEIMF